MRGNGRKEEREGNGKIYVGDIKGKERKRMKDEKEGKGGDGEVRNVLEV